MAKKGTAKKGVAKPDAGAKEAAAMCKVRLFSPEGTAERLWAEALGRGRYRLNNVPFFAYGISCGDVVKAKATEVEGIRDFVEVISKSGHRTIRVVFEKDIAKDKKARAAMDSFTEAGCTYEGMNGMLFAVDIPPDVDVWEVARLAESMKLEWEYADPTGEEVDALIREAEEP